MMESAQIDNGEPERLPPLPGRRAHYFKPAETLPPRDTAIARALDLETVVLMLMHRLEIQATNFSEAEVASVSGRYVEIGLHMGGLRAEAKTTEQS